ncbi:hypothetical protein AWL63_18320 [Sphingomonas panacis]|uniref:Uncharacterized protein n=2 Tax=Sphingomonas panacis TaxID=1560345 RepID=A0A1B3ZDU6_9SPHN|nr:hypothetical protein AWL63_18320 [Sphingomonas panacis]
MVLAQRDNATGEWEAVRATNPKRAGEFESVSRGLQTLADKFAVRAGTSMLISGRYYPDYDGEQRIFPIEGLGIDAVNAHAFVAKG